MVYLTEAAFVFYLLHVEAQTKHALPKARNIRIGTQ